MRLKKLELFGFKSFADRTTIVFDEGVTCIVGPNGCGKSNISDSIRWVLGERSPKILRGSKMEDVIFAGTDFRKPLNLAEVSLTFDNTDKTLPVEYNEVTITRRLYRSGDSEYLINKTVCRLKDIYDLVMDTGLGSSSYSMIEQGKIDYILKADPLERRILIEEAAGISKYEAKKDEAVRKLERTEENRLRLNDIIHEVQKNIQYAERQARRAQRYQEHYEKLKDLEIRKAFFDIEALCRLAEEILAEESRQKTELENFDKILQSKRKEQEELNEVLRGILDRYSAEDTKRHQIQSRIEHNEQTLVFHQDKRMGMASRKGQIEQELHQLHERIHKNSVEIKHKNQEIDSLNTEKDQSLSALARSEASMADLENQAAEIKQRLDQIRTDAFQAAAETTRIRNDYHRASAFLDTAHEHQKKQQQTHERLEQELQTWTQKSQGLSEDLTILQERQTGFQETKALLKSQWDKLKQSVDLSKETLTALDKEIHEKETRLQMIQEIDRKNEAAGKTFLDPETDQHCLQFIETLRSVFQVQDGYEWALEAALDNFSKSLIASSPEAAETLLTRIREKMPAHAALLVKDVTFEQLHAAQSLTHPLIQAPLAEIAQTQPGYEHLFYAFSHDVYLLHAAPTAAQIRELTGLAPYARFLSPDGTSVGPYGRVHYRHADPFSENSVFQRASEMRHLESALQTLRENLITRQRQVITDETLMEDISINLDQIDGSILEATIQKESFESHQEGIYDRLESLRKELRLISLESEQFALQIQEAGGQKAKLEADLMQFDAHEKNIRENQEQLAAQQERLDREKSQALKLLTEAQVRYKHIEEQLSMLRDSLKLLDELMLQDQLRITNLEAETRNLEEKSQALQEKDDTIKAEQTALDSQRRESEIALELIRREKESAESKLAESRQASDELQTQVQEIQNQFHQFDMKKMDLKYQEKNIHERLQQVYKIQLADLAAENYPLEGDPAAAEERLLELRGKVESLGTVNLLAIEEYDELKQRFDFLQHQMKDLEEAREQLLETIRQINRTTKALFEQTFTDVQLAFQDYYQTLFRGGSARLVLTDEANPLESGIDIVVRPPGKKLQNITLLSGGEKALTAIALLFALFKIKPSPFCVLDEVDAPLDEANVDRFLNVLTTFLKMSQFLIVTHNRKTIAMGNSLYGVTMEEAGVSKMVSVRVAQEAIAKQESEAQKAAPSVPTSVTN